ncbi:hypothetical protein [Brevibacillus sp. H7]|uniref:hypothetical protein n=1 Tax=Brevibacillus sp. H7 TaxID=3349138 RepID=UPI0037F4C806
MKRLFVCALLVCLAMSQSTLTGVSPAYGANVPWKRMTQAPKPLPKPVHQFISFNDFQVVGLNSNGWNWVKNDEFILPPETPLEIDIVQTTYAKGINVSSSSIYLDGVELPEFRMENKASQPALQWSVPRFSIPAGKLAPGAHILTFVVKDAQQKSSTVNVRFIVEALQHAKIYSGTAAAGTPIPTGSTESIPGLSGSKRYYASSAGTWKLYRQGAETEMKKGSGQSFYTGTLPSGLYDLVFEPTDVNLSPSRFTLHVGLTDIYLGMDATGQKLTPGQKITAKAAPSTVQLFADLPGRWSVSGTGQSIRDSRHFEVQLPEKLAGMTLTVTYEPEGGNSTSINTLRIEIPGVQNSCAPSPGGATLDIMMQQNERSSLRMEKEDLTSSNNTVTLYQKPIYKIWLTTAGDHLKYGSDKDADEGPGVWAVDNMVVDSSRLNWDHTALELSSYSPGRYKINYYSKKDPNVSWCGYVRVYEDTPPTPSAPVCERDEIGEAPALLPIRLTASDGRQLSNGEVVTVHSLRALDAFSKVSLSANHVVHHGVMKVKKDASNKKDRRFLWVPDLRWEYGMNTIGEYHYYSGGKIFSENVVKVVYNDSNTLRTFRPKHDKESDVTAYDGLESIDMKEIIADNGNKPGTYTIHVTHKLAYRTCGVYARLSTFEKEVDTVEREQTFSATFVVK